MSCRQLATPEEQVRQLTERLRAFTEFALAQQQWEADVLDDDGPWFDQMPEPLLQRFEEIQRLRNKALGV